MGIRKTTRVAKAVGAGPLVDYAGAKLAKRRLKGKAAQKHVEDKTSGRRAALSAAVAVSTVASGGAGAAKYGLKKVAQRAAKKAHDKKYGYFKVDGQKKRVRYNKGIGANPSSLRHLKGDKKIK
jgi:hypothetical protein